MVKKPGFSKPKNADGGKNRAAKEPDDYQKAVIAYNDAFTAFNDLGLQLLIQRRLSVELLGLIESLVNSIAKTPKSFGADLEEIALHREDFNSILEQYDRQDLATARKTAAGAGAGVVAGAGVAAIAPTAAMWVATTFGTASTGTAISALSGAAATNAALAWLGGGAVAAGGAGMSAGSAFLALAGPVGWTIAGATILTSVVVITTRKFRSKKEKNKILSDVKRNTASVSRAALRVTELLVRSADLHKHLRESYIGAQSYSGSDYVKLGSDQQKKLSALVNNAKSCAALLSERFEEPADESDTE